MASILTFYTASILVCIFAVFAGIHSGILSRIYSDILSCINSDIRCGICQSSIFAGIHSRILSGMYSDMHSGILSGILSGIELAIGLGPNGVRVQTWPTTSGDGDMLIGSGEEEGIEWVSEWVSEGVAPLLKSRDPHLADGEKQKQNGSNKWIHMDCPTIRIKIDGSNNHF